MRRALPPWLRRPLWQGLLLGFAFPLFVTAPSVLAGRFDELPAGVDAYFLLPLLSLVALPTGIASVLLQRTYRERQAVWRLCSGLFLGGSAAGALLLGSASSDLPTLPRLAFALFGGVLLAGFWTWIGGFLGAFPAYERRERRLKAAGGSPATR